MKLKKIKVSELILDAENANIHTQKSIDVIKASLAKFGQQKNIVVNKDNVVIAGNGTLQAAKELGIEYLQCNVSQLSKSELKAYALADNKTAKFADFDLEILNVQLEDLKDFDMDDFGFDSVGDFEFDDETHEKTKISEENKKLKLEITFESEEQQEGLFHELLERNYNVRAF